MSHGLRDGNPISQTTKERGLLEGATTLKGSIVWAEFVNIDDILDVVCLGEVVVGDARC